jgi:membrane-bound lytic murein transglycosylase D
MPLLDILPRAAVRGALWVSALVLAGCASLGTDAPSGADPATAARGPAPIAGAATSPPGATAPGGPAAPVAGPAPVSPPAPSSATGTPSGAPQPAVSAPQARPTPESPPVVVSERPGDRHADIWQRLRAGFAMPELPTPLVEEKERFYLSKPDALQRMFARGGRYLHYIVEEVEKRGMPTELALLPFVESAMNPVALSSAQAAGLWQFIPSTGRQYELSQNWWVDNRRDVVQSTRAALDYLQKIYEMHDRDWFLALASYNWGENAVARAVKNNRARGKPTDYLSLSMPNETRHYVPKLIALKHIVLRADELGLALPAVPNRPYFATIEKTRPIDLKLAAQFAGMSVEEFVALNPAHNRPVIAASRNNEIKLPADRVDDFVRAMERHDAQNKPLASWQPYTVKPGESIDDVARRGGVSAGELLKANGLSAGRRLLPGTQLIAPQASVKDERQIESFEGPKVYEHVTVPAVYHRVKRKETLATVAASYGVSVSYLQAWNGGVKSVRPGASLMVRPSTTQTVLTNPDGARQVLARSDPASPQRTAGAATRGGAEAGKSAAEGTRTASGPRAAPASKPVARAPAAGSGSVRAVYKPPRAAAAPKGRAAKPSPKRPRT